METAFDTGGVKGATDDVVTHTGEVLHTAAADEHDAVFLEVVAFTGDVGVDFLLVLEAHTSHLTHGGVRFLRGGGVNSEAYTALLRTSVQSF